MNTLRYSMIIAAAIVLMIGCDPHGPATTSTTNKHAEWYLEHLNDRYASIVRTASGVDFTEGLPDNPKKATMSLGSTIVEPDHHGYRKYTIAKIEGDGVVIEYFSRFDHRSFGKELIEEDRGTFKLKWKPAQ